MSGRAKTACCPDRDTQIPSRASDPQTAYASWGSCQLGAVSVSSEGITLPASPIVLSFSDSTGQFMGGQPCSLLKQSGRCVEKAQMQMDLLPSPQLTGKSFMAPPRTVCYNSTAAFIRAEHKLCWHAKLQKTLDKSTTASARLRTPSPEYQNPWMDSFPANHIMPPPLRVVLQSHSSPSFMFAAGRQAEEVPSLPTRAHAAQCKPEEHARCQVSTQQLSSKGSVGHPKNCAKPCKYSRKAKGCKDGVDCDHCHICIWTTRCNVHGEAHRMRYNRKGSMNTYVCPSTVLTASAEHIEESGKKPDL